MSTKPLDVSKSFEKDPSEWTDEECREHSWIHSVTPLGSSPTSGVDNDESVNNKMSNIDRCIREPPYGHHQSNEMTCSLSHSQLLSKPKIQPRPKQSSAIITDSENISSANESPVYTIVVKQQNTFVQKLTFVLHLYLTVVVSYFIYHLKDDFIQQTKTVQYSFSLFS